MFKGATFHFTQPFCDCQILNYGYGLSSMNGSPAFIFQCGTCGTAVSMPLVKLSAGFEFDYMAPGTKIGGLAGDDPDELSETENDSIPVVERENVIYGPWSGSDRPEDNSNEEVMYE